MAKRQIACKIPEIYSMLLNHFVKASDDTKNNYLSQIIITHFDTLLDNISKEDPDLYEDLLLKITSILGDDDELD